MPRVELRRAGPADLEALAPRMRKADALEAERSCGLPPLAVLQKSVEASDGQAGALYIDGEIAAVYGLAHPEVLGAVAVPWLLTSDVVERHKLTFMRVARVVVGRWAEENPVLLQMVDVEYVGAQLFLEKLGFQLLPPIAHGTSKAPFRPAVRIRNV